MIKNIIFDFGGVLFNLDFKKSFAAFKALGVQNIEAMFSQHTADALFQDLETGRISAAQFFNELKKETHQSVTDTQLQEAWNAMLLGYRKESLDFLIPLQHHYNLYLLSNTNAIHYNYFSKLIKPQTGYNSLESFFTKTYYSHNIHLRKPDTAVFEFVLQDAGIHASDTLFIDDTFSNFPNAERLGIATHLLLPTERIEQLNYEQY